MSDERWARIERLFEDATNVPAPQRDAWLEAHCADPDIRREVAAMLEADARVRGVLDRPTPSPVEVTPRLGLALAGRYTVQHEIGRGGMSTVYLAFEEKHERQVVIKVLNPEVAAAFGAGRFLAEVHIAAQLSHPHILGLIDSGEADGLLYYVMPYAGGETLRARVDAGPVPRDEALTLLGDIADGLAYAHRQGVVHRDLKPENVLCVGGHAFLLDFGIAKLRSAADDGHVVTGSGVLLGTPGYWAPEQAAGGAVDQRVDVYAWGVVAREVLGTHGLPEALDDLVNRCLSYEPDDRPERMEDIRDALRGEPVPSDPDRFSWLPVRWLVTGGVALVAAGITWMMINRPAGAVDPFPQPVAAAALVNETGDSSLGTWGRLAGDWITQGLQEAGVASVVPWPSALLASERLAAERATGTAADPVAVLRRETGAGTVVTGAYYRIGDSVRFQAEISDAESGRLLGAPRPVTTHLLDIESGIRELRDRLISVLALWTNERLSILPGLSRRPPTYEAYRAFDRGMQRHLDQSYRAADTAFTEAYTRDTTFVVAMLYAALSAGNYDAFDRADSLLTLVAGRRAELSEYHERMLEYMLAHLAGDAEHALQAITRAAELAPGSRAGYNRARTANMLNRPREALASLEALDPDHGAMLGWSSYFTQLAHALHLLGEYGRELDAARGMLARFPDRRVGHVLEARALAGAGRLPELDSLLDAIAPMSPATYWSQGAAMVVAGEELLAHGRPEDAPRYLDRAVDWFANQLAREPGHTGHRYWMGSALYDARRWEDAEPYFTSLVRDRPASLTNRGLAAVVAARAGSRAAALEVLGPAPGYSRGAHTVWRARIAAILSDRDQAVSLLSEALAQGVEGWAWLHASAVHDFALMAADPRAAALIDGRR